MTTRLASVEPELAERIGSLSPDAQRRVAVSVALKMLDVAAIDDAGEFRSALREGPYGDTPVRERIRAQMRQTEQERLKAGSASDTDSHRRWQRIARAFTAADFAMSQDPAQAALEAAFESRYGMPKGEGIAYVKQLLEGL
jgi:hypothetical protein